MAQLLVVALSGLSVSDGYVGLPIVAVEDSSSTHHTLSVHGKF